MRHWVVGILFCAAGSSAIADIPTGVLFGKPFRPNHFTIKVMPHATASINGKVLDRAQGYILNMQVGDAFMPDTNVEIWWNAEVGKSVDGSSISWKPTEFGTEAHSRQSFPVKGKSATVARGITSVFLASGKKHESFSDRIQCLLAFGKRSGNRIPVSVNLVLPNRTKVDGKFWATFEK